MGEYVKDDKRDVPMLQWSAEDRRLKEQSLTQMHFQGGQPLPYVLFRPSNKWFYQRHFIMCTLLFYKLIEDKRLC